MLTNMINNIDNGAFIIIGLTLGGIVLRMIGPWRKQISEAEMRLRREAEKRARQCEGELSVVRHRERGSRQMIYSLLHLFDLEPASREGALQNIRSTLEDMERRETFEAIAALNGIEEMEDAQ